MSFAQRWGVALAQLLNPAIQDNGSKRVTVIMAASRYSRTPRSVRTFMRRFGNTDAIICFTEMQDENRAKQLERDNRTLIRYGGGPAKELAISVPNTKELTQKDLQVLSGMTYERQGGATAPARRLLSVLVDGVNVHTFHAAALGSNRAFPRYHRADVFKADIRALVPILKADGVGVLAADFNTFLTVPNQMRDFLDAELHKAGYHRPAGNTGIVGFYTKGLTEHRISTMSSGAFSDHAIKRLRAKVR